MAAKYSITETRRQRTTRSGYGASSNRSTFGYWVPLVLTVTAATVGIAAWIWSERDSEEEEKRHGGHNPGGIPPPEYANMSGGLPSGPGAAGHQGPSQPEWQGGQPPVAGGFQGPPPPGGYQGPPPPGGYQEGYQENRDTRSRSTNIEQTGDTGLVARVSSALGMKRAPSPGQAYDWASKGISAGVAAAGAMVGGAITSISEGGKEGFDDQERWSEEAEQRDNDREVSQGIKRRGTADEYWSGSVSVPRAVSVNKQKRKDVCIVVSSVQSGAYDDVDIGGHASILAHLPEYVHPDTTRVFVLIYAPDMSSHPLSKSSTNRRQSQSMTSSYSNISAADAQMTPVQTPGSFDQEGILSHVDPQPLVESTTTLYKTLHNQATALVDRDTMIMPFTTLQGYKHILKSITPETAYIQESLCGNEGEVVSDLSGWVRNCVVVIGDEEGMGGLADTDDELERRRGSRRSSTVSNGGQIWWKREDRTGLGRGVSVVEATKIGDDWRRRVNSED